MKKLVVFLQIVLMAAVWTACSDDKNEGYVNVPTIEVKLAGVEPTAASVEVITEYATSCSYVCVKADQKLPELNEVLASDKTMEVTQGMVVKMENLTPETEYVFLAAAKGEGGAALSKPLAFATPAEGKDEPADEVLEATLLLDATYRNDNPAGAGQYSIVVGKGMPDKNGNPTEVGDFQLFLHLINVADENPTNATLPAGVYNPASDYSAFSWNPVKAVYYVRESEGADGLVPSPFIEGTVTVARVDGGYDILLDGGLLSEAKVKVHFKGEIKFEQVGTSNERFIDDQEVVFENAQGAYYGNWFRYFADDMNLMFYTGNINSNGKQTDGYCLNMQAYMDKLADPYDPNVRLQEGVYTISDREITAQNSMPMMLQMGEHLNLMGDYFNVGTFLTHVNGETGRILLGLCVKGTMTVKHVGEDYSIEFDFTTSEGKKIHGVYDGPLKMANKCDNNEHEPKRPWSTLQEDRVMNIPSDAVAEAYLLGDYLMPGLNSWLLNIYPSENSTPGDMITTEFFTQGETIECATYEVKKEFKPLCAIPGFMDYAGNVMYTWYGDFASTDADGYASVLGPIAEGRFTIEQEGEGQKFVFDLVDDAGHSIAGEWTGKVRIYDVREDMGTKAKVMKRARMAKFRF